MADRFSPGAATAAADDGLQVVVAGDGVDVVDYIGCLPQLGQVIENRIVGGGRGVKSEVWPT